jgi:hypothetical protein
VREKEIPSEKEFGGNKPNQTTPNQALTDRIQFFILNNFLTLVRRAASSRNAIAAARNLSTSSLAVDIFEDLGANDLFDVVKALGAKALELLVNAKAKHARI